MFKYSLEKIDLTNTHTKEDLLSLLKKHDYLSFIYSVRTAKISYAIGKEMRLNKGELFLHFLCGLYHDIGKLGMESSFINYEGRYTIEMYGEMKNHPIGGAELLKYVHAEKELIDNSLYHHCNYDGTGYPGGLFEKEIPLYPRITRVSDSVDAFMTKRCYKEGGPANSVLDDLMQYSELSYDPEVLFYFSLVHKKVMKECHTNGHDFPSQNIYMHYLTNLYPLDFDYPILDDLIEKK